MTDKIKFTINGEESVLAVDDGMTMRVGSVSPSMELTVGTVVPSKIAPPLIVFANQQNNEPVMTIHPDGKITLGEKAEPTEAAAACIKAMDGMIRDMISNAVQAERAATAAWLRKSADWHDKNDDGLSGFGYIAQADRESADSITRGDHLK